MKSTPTSSFDELLLNLDLTDSSRYQLLHVESDVISGDNILFTIAARFLGYKNNSEFHLTQIDLILIQGQGSANSASANVPKLGFNQQPKFESVKNASHDYVLKIKIGINSSPSASIQDLSHTMVSRQLLDVHLTIVDVHLPIDSESEIALLCCGKICQGVMYT